MPLGWKCTLNAHFLQCKWARVAIGEQQMLPQEPKANLRQPRPTSSTPLCGLCYRKAGPEHVILPFQIKGPFHFSHLSNKKTKTSWPGLRLTCTFRMCWKTTPGTTLVDPERAEKGNIQAKETFFFLIKNNQKSECFSFIFVNDTALSLCRPLNWVKDYHPAQAYLPHLNGSY